MTGPLPRLAEPDLRALITALRTGRLTPPYTTLGVQRILADTIAADVAVELQKLQQSGMTPGTVARCLELIADTASQRPPLEDLIDLVTTGPELGGVAEVENDSRPKATK